VPAGKLAVGVPARIREPGEKPAPRLDSATSESGEGAKSESEAGDKST
jgi:hypothetical protein